MMPGASRLLDGALWTLLVTGVSAVVWTGSRWWMDTARAADARESLASALQLSAELRQARDLPAVLADGPPTEDSLGQVTDALGEAGIASTALRRVQPEVEGGSERVEGTTLTVRRSVKRVELDGMTLPELGRFLAVWRVRNPLWIPVMIQLAPRMETSTEARAATDSQTPRWLVNISIASVYLPSQERSAHDASTDPVRGIADGTPAIPLLIASHARPKSMAWVVRPDSPAVLPPNSQERR